MRPAGVVALGGLILLGGLLQRGPEICPLPLRSFLRAGVPPSSPAPEPPDTTAGGGRGPGGAGQRAAGDDVSPDTIDAALRDLELQDAAGRRRAFDVLRALAAHRRLPAAALSVALAHEDAGVRIAAVRLLRVVGDPAARRLVERVRDDRSSEVAAAAGSALVSWQP